MFSIKIDMITAEIKSNLSEFKVFYNLINNLKSRHKLTDQNYNRLAVISRIIQILVLDSGLPIGLVIDFALIIIIAISSRKFIWILQSIFVISGLLIAGLTLALWMCTVIILFSYYNLRFDQINKQISKISNGKLNVIGKRRKKLLIKLISEHNQVSLEIHKINLINLMLCQSTAITFITLSIIKIITLYLLINFKGFSIKLTLFDTFLLSHIYFHLKLCQLINV